MPNQNRDERSFHIGQHQIRKRRDRIYGSLDLTLVRLEVLKVVGLLFCKEDHGRLSSNGFPTFQVDEKSTTPVLSIKQTSNAISKGRPSPLLVIASSHMI